MFESFKSFISKVVNRVLNKGGVQEKLGVEIAVSDKMSQAIEMWTKLYEGTPHTHNANYKKMDLAASIASELARLTTLELDSSITGSDFLNEQYQEVLKNIRIYTEFACAKGGVVFKPYVNEEAIEVDCVQADCFYPISYNSRGDITSAAFLEYKVVGKDLYTRVEHHNLVKDGYHINNRAFLKKNYSVVSTDNLGQPIPLQSVDDWSSLAEDVTIKNVNRPLFAYFKMPLANHIDNKSPLGVSVFSRAIQSIEEADKQYDRILWEYEGSELAIDADDGVFKRDTEGNLIMPAGRERLFRALGFDNEEMYKVYSPNIRDVSLFNGLNQLLRKIEFKCGLAYGVLSDAQESDKTAEEIKSSKQRSYSTVKDIQRNLQFALEQLVEAMDVLCKLYNLETGAYEMSFNWDDSLIMNKDVELASMQADVSAGILRPEIYLAKKYGCSEEEALKMMPNVEESIKSPFHGLEE